MDKILDKLKNNQNLTFEESKKIFLDIMSGNMKEESIYNFLTIISSKFIYNFFYNVVILKIKFFF